MSSRALLGKPCAPKSFRSEGVLLLGDGDGEASAALFSTALQNEAPAGRTHALAESMRPLTTLSVRLIGTLHDLLREGGRIVNKSTVRKSSAKRCGLTIVRTYERPPKSTTGFRAVLLALPARAHRMPFCEQRERRESRERALPDSLPPCAMSHADLTRAHAQDRAPCALARSAPSRPKALPSREDGTTVPPLVLATCGSPAEPYANSEANGTHARTPVFLLIDPRTGC